MVKKNKNLLWNRAVLSYFFFSKTMLRNLDIIIYGATGFTGKHAIPILSKLAKGSNPNLTWGIAGRSEEKLKDVLSGLESQLGIFFNILQTKRLMLSANYGITWC